MYLPHVHLPGVELRLQTKRCRKPLWYSTCKNLQCRNTDDDYDDDDDDDDGDDDDDDDDGDDKVTDKWTRSLLKPLSYNSNIVTITANKHHRDDDDADEDKHPAHHQQQQQQQQTTTISSTSTTISPTSTSSSTTYFKSTRPLEKWDMRASFVGMLRASERYW